MVKGEKELRRRIEQLRRDTAVLVVVPGLEQQRILLALADHVLRTTCMHVVNTRSKKAVIEKKEAPGNRGGGRIRGAPNTMRAQIRKEAYKLHIMNAQAQPVKFWQAFASVKGHSSKITSLLSKMVKEGELSHNSGYYAASSYLVRLMAQESVLAATRATTLKDTPETA